jgi:hypothetical protein
LWKDKGRQDANVPLATNEPVQVIHIDGTRRELQPRDGGVALTIGEDPILVLYESATKNLPAAIEAPAANVDAMPGALARHGATTISVASHGLGRSAINLIAPPFWTVEKTAPGGGGNETIQFAVTPPEGSAVREADIAVSLADSGGRKFGELTLHVPVGQ